MAEIDSLDIKISAEMSDASKSIDKLVDKIETLESSLKRISNINLKNFNGLGNKENAGVTKLSTGLKNISTISEKTTAKINKFSLSLKILNKAALFAEKGFDALWKSAKSSMDYIETLNYFDAAFGQVASKADLTSWNQMGYDGADAYYNSFSKRAKELTSKMSGFSILESGMLKSNGTLSLGINPEQVMNYQAMFGQMSSSMGVTSENALKLSNVLTQIGADLASVKNMNFNKVWNDMASGLAGMSRTLDKYGANIRNVNLQQRLTDIGIDANIQSLNQNDKALLRTIILLDSTRYAWGDLAKTIDQPSNQLRLLQSNFANLSRTIGNIFLPVVAKVLPYANMLVQSLQRLAQWLVKLLGFDGFDWGGASGAGSSDVLSDIYDEAADSAGNLSNNLGDASKNANKLKNATLGIDELNVVNDNNTGAGSGGSDGLDLSDAGLLDAALNKMLEEYQTAWDIAFENMEKRANTFADNVAKAFKESGLYGVGEYLSNGLANAMDSIPWNGIYEKANTFGTGLADFLNGLISPELFSSVGTTVSNSLNTAIYTALSFGETFDFYDFGVSIAAGINNFFATFDFKDLAKTLNTWVDGIKDAIRGALDTVTWDSVLEGASTFLGTLEIDTVEILIGAFVIKNSASTVVALMIDSLRRKFGFQLSLTGISLYFKRISLSTLGLPAFQVVGNQIVDWINEQIELNFGQKCVDAIGLSLMSLTGGAFGLALAGPLGAIGGAIISGVLAYFTTERGQELWSSIYQKLFNFDYANELVKASKEFFSKAFSSENFLDFGKNIVAGIASGITIGIAFLIEPIADLFDFVVEKICEVFGIHSPAAEMEPLGENILRGIVVGFTNTFSEWTKALSDWYDNHVALWFTDRKWSDLYSPIKDEMSNTWSESALKWKKDLSSWWKEKVEPRFANKEWSNLYDSIKTQLHLKWEETDANWNSDLSKWWKDDVEPRFENEKWLNLFDVLRTSMKTKWSDMETNWKTDISNWWSANVTPWFTLDKWVEMMSGVSEAFGKTFKNAVNSAASIFNRFINWINEHMHFEWDDIEIAGQTIVSGGSIQLFTIPTIPQFELGGFPEDGLFFANHTELVGQFSNGKTAVANNDQIIAGIQQGVYEANSEQNALIQEMIGLLQDIRAKDTTIKMNGREVGKGMSASSRRQGYTLRTVY